MESKYRCEQALTQRLSLHAFLFDHCPEEPPSAAKRAACLFLNGFVERIEP
jgi:hypothetical protein